MLRLETEFVVSDLSFSKWDPKGLLSICCETVQTKYAGQLTYYRQDSVGQLEELQSVGLSVGGTSVKESSKYQSFIYTSHTDPTLRLWTLNDLRKPIKRYNYHSMSVEEINTSPFDGEEFVSCSKDSTFAIWTMTESEPIFSSANKSSFPVMSAQYHPQNSSLLLVAPLDSKIELWNNEEKRKVYSMNPADDILFSSMATSPYNEFWLTVADENGKVYLWDLRRLKKPMTKWQSHGLSIPQIKFNPHDENLLGTIGTDSYFHLWYLNSKTPQCLKSFKTHHLPITSFDWSLHDFGLLCDSSSDYSICMWNFIQEPSNKSKL